MKIIKILFITTITLLLTFYIIGIYVFSEIFMPNTIVNGQDLSQTKIFDLYKHFINYSKNNKLKIIYKNKINYIKFSDFDYKGSPFYNQKVMQNTLLWPLEIFMAKSYNLNIDNKFNEKKLNDLINNLNIYEKNQQKSEDAAIIFDNNKYQIKKEVVGNIINKHELKKTILKFIKLGRSELNINKYDSICQKPKILSTNPALNERLYQIDKIIKSPIIYDFSDRKEELRNQRLLSLYEFDDKNVLIPNLNKVDEFINELVDKYDTYGKERSFKATDLEEVKIPATNYGWKIDIDKTKENLINILENPNYNENILIPIYLNTAQSRNINDIGDSYIEIDINRQHLWLYRDGNLIINTDIVTGNKNRGNSTPSQIGVIWSKERNRYLTGPDYKSFVKFWMPINRKGIGLHDASWRSKFGSNIYITRGSHGCINIPNNVMKEVFDNSFKGMPVIIYNSSL